MWLQKEKRWTVFGSYLARTYPRPVVWVFRVGLKHSAWTDIRIYAPEGCQQAPEDNTRSPLGARVGEL